MSDPRKTARFHIGPFYLTPAFSINRIGVDNNVFNEEGDRRSDFVVILAPGATVWLPFANRVLVTATMKNGVSYYKRHTSQRSLDPGINVLAEFTLGRMVPFVSKGYDQSRTRPNSEIDVRVPRTTVTSTLGIAYQPRGRFSIELSASRSDDVIGKDARYVGVNLGSNLNGRRQGVRLRLDRKLTSLTGVHFTIENIQNKFTVASNKDSAGVRVAVGAQFGRRALVSGQAEIGYRTLKTVASAIPSFDSWVADVSLARQFRASEATVDWSRDIQVSFLADHPYFVANGTSFKIRQQLGGSFDGVLQLGRTNFTYASAPGNGTPPHVVIKGVRGDLGYRLNRGARLGLVLARTWRSSELQTFHDFSGLSIGISFSVGF